MIGMPDDFDDRERKFEENDHYANNNALKYLKTLGERVSKLEKDNKNLNFKLNVALEEIKHLNKC